MNVLSGRVALVTGASRGIGAAIARTFAKEGARVAVHGRDTAALSAVRSAIEQDGGTAIETVADVTKFGEIEDMRKEVEQSLGPIDILVANAGGSYTTPGRPVETIEEEGWHASINGNLTATFLTIKSVLPGMKKRKNGNITISSAAGRRPHPQAPLPYSAAKAGVQILTQAVAVQAGPYGIRVNCVAPETILTERNWRRIPQEQQVALQEMHPLKRLGTPEDVAGAALFLASQEASWVTGVVLDVAGGAVMV
jgi:3-oxoacyl-[acyl-carrier protein] reductase